MTTIYHPTHPQPAVTDAEARAVIDACDMFYSPGLVRDMRRALAAFASSLVSQAVQPDSDLERYIAANYPDSKGDNITERVIDALEKMDIEIGMREIALPAAQGAPAQAAAAQAAQLKDAVPLCDADISACLINTIDETHIENIGFGNLRYFVRAIEAMHGIHTL